MAQAEHLTALKGLSTWRSRSGVLDAVAGLAGVEDAEFRAVLFVARLDGFDPAVRRGVVTLRALCGRHESDSERPHPRGAGR